MVDNFEVFDVELDDFCVVKVMDFFSGFNFENVLDLSFMVKVCVGFYGFYGFGIN